MNKALQEQELESADRESAFHEEAPSSASTPPDELSKLINMVKTVEAMGEHPDDEVTSFRLKKMREIQQYKRRLNTIDRKFKTLLKKRKFIIGCINTCNQFL